MLEKIVRDLVTRRADMERAVFASPPSDWPAFQKRLGQYLELDALIDRVAEIMSGKEKDE